MRAAVDNDEREARERRLCCVIVIDNEMTSTMMRVTSERENEDTR